MNYFKITFLSIFLAFVFCTSTYASIEHYYEDFYDEYGNTVSSTIILEKDKEININKGEGSSFFILLNGSPISDISYISYENKVFFPVRELFEAIGSDVIWDSSHKTISISGLEKDIIINSNNYMLSVDKAYVSANDLSIVLGYDVSLMNYPYTRLNDVSRLRCPLLIIDCYDKDEAIPAETLLDELKGKLFVALENFKETSEYRSDNNWNFVIAEIENKIKNMTITDEFSNYYVFDGPYVFYVDKITGEYYWELSKIHRGYIKKLDFNDPYFFVMDYFMG